jgi:hypothetical protein
MRLGQVAWNKGMRASPETRAKLSAAREGKPHPHEGRPPSEATRAKQSAISVGRLFSPETRAKLSAANMGRGQSPETIAKRSVALTGCVRSPETRAKMSLAKWKGGSAISGRKSKAKRRILGFNPLNSWFPGCEAHHLDHDRVAYIPEELHRSVSHDVWTGRNMDKINAVAFEYLSKSREVK